MSEQEILETIAARIGLHVIEYRGSDLPIKVNRHGVIDTWWNPRLYNGDALELAVEFRIHLEFDENCVIPSTDDWAFTSVRHNGDKIKATREAIYNTAKSIVEGL